MVKVKKERCLVLKYNFKLSKLIAVAILTSFTGVQICFAQAADQPYKILPPMSGQDSKIQNVESLPNLPIYTDNMALKGGVSTVPTGTQFLVTINSTINSISSQVGEIFTANLISPISLNGNVLIPEGSEVIGQVTYVVNSGRVGKNGEMEIRFTNIKTPNGQQYPISGKLSTNDKTGILKGGSVKKQIVSTIATPAVTTATGAIAGLSAGAIAGHAAAGTLLGLPIGALVGIVYAVERKGKDVVIPSGYKMDVVLETPLTVNR